LQQALDFRELFEHTPGLYLILSPDFHIIAVNDAYARATLTTRESIVGRHLFDVFPDNPDDVSATGVSNLRASLERVLRFKRPDKMAIQKYDVRRPEDGGFEEKHWSPLNIPVLGPRNEVKFIIHRAEDVTELVRLAASDEQQRAHVRELGNAIEELRRANESVAQQMEANERLQAQLQEAVKMRAIGQLTGGVAHDFNNLLTVILGNAEVLADELRSDPRLRALAEMTQSAAERGAELTNRMLAFARQQALEPRAIDANKLIAGMDGLLRRTLGEDQEIEVVRRAGLWPTMVDPSQLESALLNLAINARDAMPKGGKLTIETANAHVDDEYAASHDEVKPGQYTMISISDSGEGMSRETMERAFEPFYTTKGVGKGTGLGLSMVYGFVKQSGGHVKLYSEIGNGTTVKLYLPRADAVEAEAVTAAASERGGSETVLVTEDDDMVRAHVGRMLRDLGYTVIMASNGPEALKIVDSGAAFDVLLTDVIMPGGMNGRELADAAAVRRPGLKVLFMSGYTENAIVHHGRLDPGVQLLHKPYRRRDLAAKLRRVIDGASPRR